MNFRNIFCILTCIIVSGCTGNIHIIEFDRTKEVSGKKLAIKDINPDIPKNWDNFNFLVLEYRINTSQRFQLGFNTSTGYNELRIMSYVPNAWNKLVIPIKYFTDYPDPSIDLASTNNKPRYTGWVNLGGERHKMHGVDSIGFRMRRAIGEAKIEIRNIYVSKNDPGDEYMEEFPAVDVFGQSSLVDYPEKIKSISQLRKEWTNEELELESGNITSQYTRFGGYKDIRVKGTGYFRTECIDGVWWFVDPEGYLFLSIGVDCVDILCGGGVREFSKRSNMFENIRSLDSLNFDMSQNFSYGKLNVYRRYGENYKERSLDMVFKRMEKWGLNTVANWSSDIVKKSGRKAFLHPLDDIGLDSNLMGLCDIYAIGFKENLEKSIAAQISEFKDNPWLIGYFIGNEPAWLNQEYRLCDVIINGDDIPIRQKLIQYLDKFGDNKENRKKFIYDTFKVYLNTVSMILKSKDPNHLNLGIRFGDPQTLSDEILKMCSVFDVFSFNCYSLKPDNKMMDRIHGLTGKPMIIGEYHFGTVDRGYAQSLWQVDSQEQRGVAYRYYTENAYSHPGLIGTAYFQWSDQDLTGRFDGENYNCGLIDVTDRPYKEQVEAMFESSKVIFKIHKGQAKPYNIKPVNCRGHELIPDIWE